LYEQKYGDFIFSGWFSSLCTLSSAERFQGSCKWFNGLRGFGFITGEDGRDVFVHQSDIVSTSWRNLLVGQRVEYEVVEEKGRLKAKKVTAPGGVTLSSKTKSKKDGFCFDSVNGNCRYGVKCKYVHEMRSSGTGQSSNARDDIGMGRFLCFDFLEGKCRSGKRCNFEL